MNDPEKMKIIFDIGHPKDIHTFRFIYHKLVHSRHSAIMTCRDRQHNIELMKVYGIEFKCVGRHYKNIFGKGYAFIWVVLKLFRVAQDYKPDMFVSHNSLMAGVVASLFSVPHIAIEDTFNKEQTFFSQPFASVILTGDYPHPSLGQKEIRYPGYHELCYLHPRYFAPSDDIYTHLKLQIGDPYVIVRFVAWAATHDFGHKGTSMANKVKLVTKLQKYCRVFISSESPLPSNLEAYKIDIPVEQMHQALYHASFYFGESSTMAAESAVLGTPAIYLNNSRLGYIVDLEKYGLVKWFDESLSSQEKAIDTAVSYAKRPNLKKDFQPHKNHMLSEKIDVTEFFYQIIVNYPCRREKHDFQTRLSKKKETTTTYND